MVCYDLHQTDEHYSTLDNCSQFVVLIINPFLINAPQSCFSHSSRLIFFIVYFAAQEGHLDCVYWLVEHANADPQISSNDGMTPLHAAAQTGRLNVTHWLVRSVKCPITSRTCDGATPVHFAAAKGKQYTCLLSMTMNTLKHH